MLEGRGADLSVFADEKMFDSILRNLSTNAVKFTPKGGMITVAAKPGHSPRRSGGECLAGFQPENPAGMLPDGKIKIAGALICKAEQNANKHKIKKGRY